MELIKEAYYLQIMVVVLVVFDLIGYIFAHTFLKFISPRSLFIILLNPEIRTYFFFIYYITLDMPIILSTYYIIKNKEVIKDYSKFLILFSYLFLALIFITQVEWLITNYYYNNYLELQNSIFPTIIDLLNNGIPLSSFPIIVIVLLISNYKHLKFVKLWMVVFFLRIIAGHLDFSIFTYLNLQDMDLVYFLDKITQSFLLALTIRSLFLFFKDDINLLSE